MPPGLSSNGENGGSKRFQVTRADNQPSLSSELDTLIVQEELKLRNAVVEEDVETGGKSSLGQLFMACFAFFELHAIKRFFC